MSSKPKWRANIPVSRAARRGGKVVSSCNRRPLPQATTATAVSRNHSPSHAHLSPKAHQNKPHVKIPCNGYYIHLLLNISYEKYYFKTIVTGCPNT